MRAERWIDRVHSRPYTFVSIALLLVGAAIVALWAVGQIALQPSEVTVQRLRPAEGGELGRGPIVAFPASAQLAVGAALLTGALGMLAFKGYVRRVWSRNYFDYDVFRLVVRMRGASTRRRILRQLVQPMNRYQLAMELGIDWKSVDRHVDLLLRHGLLETVEASGERAYRLSERGRRLLELLEEMAEIEKDTSREK
jgi:DNA-binding transcriptional ArsR family regulator